jgi:DNA helicase HerA-like ATPase
MEYGKETEAVSQKPISDSAKHREINLVFGKTGFGKSFLAKEILIQQFKRLLIACPTDEEYPNAVEFETIEEYWEHVSKHKIFRVLNRNVFDLNALLAIGLELGNCCVCIEEAQRYMPVHSTLSDQMLKFILEGRHRNMSGILISQRPSKVNIDIRSQWTRIFSFWQTEKADVDWLRGVTGFDLEKLESLRVGEYYEITPHSAEIKILNKILDKKHPASE